jgi:hypothetical protein
MPRHSGSAIRKTRKPDRTSARQFSANPARPVFGVNRVGNVPVKFERSHPRRVRLGPAQPFLRRRAGALRGASPLPRPLPGRVTA